MYVIIYSVLATMCYTAVIVIGFVIAIKDINRRTGHVELVKSIIDEIKNYLETKEEKSMDKGQYKNRRNGEMLNKDEVQKPEKLLKVENTLSLTDLITNEADEEDYEEVADLLVALAQNTYAKYNFLIAKSRDEDADANFMQIVSHYDEDPKLHREVFTKSMDYGINMEKLQKKFAEKVSKGEVIDIGDNVVVITDDGTGQLPTGVSPINSGLEGGEIAFIITFVREDKYDDWAANNLPQENESDE